MSAIETVPRRNYCRVAWHAEAKCYRAYIHGHRGGVVCYGDSDTPGKARRVAFLHLRTYVGLLAKREQETGADLWERRTNVEYLIKTILDADPSAEYADDCEPRGVGCARNPESRRGGQKQMGN